MKNILYAIIVLILNLPLSVFGQDKSKEAYIEVVNIGVSTGPAYVVLTIHNLINNIKKEIFIDVTTLYEAFKIELVEEDYDKIMVYLLSYSDTRFIQMKNSKALKLLGFDEYNNKDYNKIDRIVVKKEIIKNLYSLHEKWEKKITNLKKYNERKIELLNTLRDSITKIRKLTTEEQKILAAFEYEQYLYPIHKTLKNSNLGQEIINLWNQKLVKEEADFNMTQEEFDRLEAKYFRQYYKKYGKNFCHVLFKYGAIFYHNCLNGMLEFGHIVI